MFLSAQPSARRLYRGLCQIKNTLYYKNYGIHQYNRCLFSKSHVNLRNSLNSSNQHRHGYSSTSLKQLESTNLNDEDFNNLVLSTALENVSKLGWTDDAIAQAVSTLGYCPLSHKVVGNGAVDLVFFFLEKKRFHINKLVTEKYNEDCNDEDPENYSEIILYDSIYSHVSYLSPFIPNWPSALALLVNSNYASKAAGTMINLADDICHLSGLKSSRLDWYTDRSMVLAILCSTELYSLTDTSDDMNDTRYAVCCNI